MLQISARHAPPRRSAPPPPVNNCRSGCKRHIARLEQFNCQLAEENDRLRRELEQGRRAA